MEHKAQHTLFVERVNNVLSSPLGCLRCVTNTVEGGEYVGIMRRADLCHLAPKCSKMSPVFENLLPRDRRFSLGNRSLSLGLLVERIRKVLYFSQH